MLLSHSVAAELKKLIQHSSHYLAGLFGGLAIGFISFPIFTRIFSVADYGLIDFIQKILLVPTALSKAGMQNSVLRFYNEKEFAANRGAARSYYSTMLFGVGAMAVAITAVFLVAVKFLLRNMIDGQLATLLCFASILILLRAIESVLARSFCASGIARRSTTPRQVLMKAANAWARWRLPAMDDAPCALTYPAPSVAEMVFVVVLAGWLFRRRLLAISVSTAPCSGRRWVSACRWSSTKWPV